MRLYIIILFTLVSLAAASVGHGEDIEREIEERSTDIAQKDIEVNGQQVLDANLGKRKRRKSKMSKGKGKKSKRTSKRKSKKSKRKS